MSTSVDHPTEPLPYIPQHDWDSNDFRERDGYTPSAVIRARIRIREQLVRRRAAGVCATRHNQPEDAS